MHISLRIRFLLGCLMARKSIKRKWEYRTNQNTGYKEDENALGNLQDAITNRLAPLDNSYFGEYPVAHIFSMADVYSNVM